MIRLMIVARTKQVRFVARDLESFPSSRGHIPSSDLNTVADRPRPASVHSSLPMTWHNWRTRTLLGLFILAFQFWPSTTETPVTTTSPVTGWSLNRTVALRSVSQSAGDATSDYLCFLVREYGVYGIMVSITT